VKLGDRLGAWKPQVGDTGSIEQLLADNKLHEQKLDEINRRFAPQAPPKPAEKVKTS
jgi:hypothetical protein